MVNHSMQVSLYYPKQPTAPLQLLLKEDAKQYQHCSTERMKPLYRAGHVTVNNQQSFTKIPGANQLSQTKSNNCSPNRKYPLKKKVSSLLIER